MKSMTGFGCGESSAGGTKYRVEIASVNRKQADFSIGLPRELSELDSAVRSRVAEKVSRGRVSVKVTLDSGTAAKSSLKFDRELAKSYAAALDDLSSELGVPVTPTAGDYFRAPGVFSLEESERSASEAWPELEPALVQALEAHDEMRRTEGDELKKDIDGRLGSISEKIDAIREIAPSTVETYRENLRRRIEESGLEIPFEDERIVKEVALFADRCDISEELTRLASHLAQFHTYLGKGQPVGRELDFLSQELNREANTIASKANSAAVARQIVEVKAEIERIREQVQNVE